MHPASETSALEKLLRPLPQRLSAELATALLDLNADDEMQQRYEVLAGKNCDGELTSAEIDELEAMVRANTLLGILKAEAQAVLDHTKSG